jgi:transketolase
MNIGPSPRSFALPENYCLEVGKGFVLRDGSDAVIFAYGAVMLNEAFHAAEILEQYKISLKVVNQPWLNRFDLNWIKSTVAGIQIIYTVDDHVLEGGFGERLIAFMAETGQLNGIRVHRFGLTALPMCGTPLEVLRHHELDGVSLANNIIKQQGRDQISVCSDLPVYNTLEAAQ